MSNSIFPPSLAPEPLEARRLLSGGVSHPTSGAPPQAAPAQSAPAIPASARATAKSPAATDAEDSAGEADAAGESGDGNDNAPAAPQQGTQQGDGESSDAAPASDGESVAPAGTTGNVEDTTVPGAAAGSSQAPTPTPARATVAVAAAPIGSAAEPAPTAPVRLPDPPDTFGAPIFLASQAVSSVPPASFSTVGELAASELAHTVFSTRAVLAVSAVERAGVQAIPAMLRTLLGNAGPAADALPASPGAPATPDVADLADLAARAMTTLGRPDAVAAFADAIAGFAHESAALGSLATAETAFFHAPGGHGRAWAVSAAVVAADTILIGQWYGARRRAARRRGNE